MCNIIRLGGGGGDLDQIQFTQNGTYVAEDYGIDGFYRCFVQVKPALGQIEATKNGVYNAEDYGVDGFERCVVNVGGGATIKNDFFSLTLGEETQTIKESGYYLIVVYGGGGNGNAVNITLPQGRTADCSGKYWINAAWYGAVSFAVVELQANDVVTMNNGNNSYDNSSTKAIYRLLNFPTINNIIDSSYKTDATADRINILSQDITLPASGNVLILFGLGGRTQLHQIESRANGYLFAGSFSRGGYVNGVGYYDVSDMPTIRLEESDGGGSYIIALGVNGNE